MTYIIPGGIVRIRRYETGYHPCCNPFWQKMTVTCLIAAHDPWFLQLIQAYAVECGLRVVQAYEGQDVLPLIHQENLAAILLHTELPGDNKEINLLLAIKTDPQASTIPVLLFYPQVTSVNPELIALADIGVQEPVSFNTFQDALIKVGICPVTSTGNRALPNQHANPPKRTGKKSQGKRA
jgi:hypothetical protein